MIEAVPVTKAKTVYVVSAYMLGEGKTDGVGRAVKKTAGDHQQPADAELQRNVRTAAPDNAPANNSIPTSGENSNPKNSGAPTPTAPVVLPQPGQQTPTNTMTKQFRIQRQKN